MTGHISILKKKLLKIILISFFFLLLCIVYTRPVFSQWTHTETPPGGMVSSIALHASGALIATSSIGNVYMSADKGDHWTYQGAAQAFTDLIGTKNGNLIGFYQSLIYRSTDEGKSWTALSVSGSFIPRNANKDGVQDSVFILSDSGNVLYSKDNGDHWIVWNAEDISQPIVFVDHNGYLFGGGYNDINHFSGTSIFRSTDRGITFTEDTLLAYGSPWYIMAFAETPGGVLLANGCGGTIRSTDSGSSWEIIDFLDAGFYFSGDFNSNRLWAHNHFGLASNGNLLFGLFGPKSGWGHGTAYYTTDEGSSWINAGIMPNIYNFSASVNDYVFAATDQGIFRSSNDGRSWTETGFGLDPSSMTGMTSSYHGLVVAADDNKDVYVSQDSGVTWTASGLNASAAASFADGSIIIGLSNGGFALSTNHGMTWTQKAINGTYPVLWGIKIRNDGSMFCYDSHGILYRSYDQGNSWFIWYTFSGVSAIAVGPSKEVFFSRYGKIFGSADDGATFQSVSDQSGDVFTVTPSGIVFFGTTTYGSLYRLQGSSAPIDVSPLFPISAHINDLTCDSLGTIYVATDKGVLRSTDDGNSWGLMSGNTDAIKILSISPDGKLYAGANNVLYSIVLSSARVKYSGYTAIMSATSSIIAGDTICYRLWDQDLNKDPLSVESYTFKDTCNSGEWENIVFKETGPNTNIFTSKIATNYGATAGTINDGTFMVKPGEIITLRYIDTLNAYGTSDTVYVNTKITGGNRALLAALESNINAGDLAVYSLADPDLNKDSSRIETYVLKDSDVVSGEAENVTFKETGTNTGIFYGTIATVWGQHSSAGYKGCFSVQGGDTLVLSYMDTLSNDGYNQMLFARIIIRGSNASLAASVAGIYPGESVQYTLTDRDLNKDTSRIETYVLRDSNSTSGEVKNVIFNETGKNTGVFVGFIATAAGTSSKNGNEDRIHVKVGDTLVLKYCDSLRSDNGSATIDAKVIMIAPGVCLLDQNYPNPFNPKTIIRFQIGSEEFVKLTIYDIRGREVGKIVNEKMGPGVYERTFDGSRFASAVYFYRLQAGTFISTKKFLLLK
jgi:photosystem II stability/assembly factor-like uncharacterized protein/sporulation protein YlmC with PRC-barrel domain